MDELICKGRKDLDSGSIDAGMGGWICQIIIVVVVVAVVVAAVAIVVMKTDEPLTLEL